jgi:hypothetical protein
MSEDIELMISKIRQVASSLDAAWLVLREFKPLEGLIVLSSKADFNREFGVFESLISGESLRLRRSIGDVVGLAFLRGRIDAEISRVMISATDRRPPIAIHPKTGQSAIYHSEKLLMLSAISATPSPLADLVKQVYPKHGIPCGISSDYNAVKVYCEKFKLPPPPQPNGA